MTRHRRVAIVLVVVGVAALLASSEEIHRRLIAVIAFAEPTIAAHPVWGAVVFTALSALGAILVFVSSWVLVPIGVQAWGPLGCFVLLWTGWFIGGLVTYSIGRYLGRPMVLRLLPAHIVARYESRIPTDGAFLPTLLVNVSIPSDIAGYFFGLLRYPPRIYFSALAIAELPYGLGAVFIGDAFIQRRFTLLLAIAGASALLLMTVWLRRKPAT